MQLSLSFEYDELKKKSLTKEDFSHLSEFEQGNFSHLLFSKYTADELCKILLQSESTLPELKISLLQQRGVCATRLDQDINEEYKDHIKGHNDSVRAALRISYALKSKKRLKKNGFDRFRKYNNAYRDFYGGKSSSKLSVTDENHEWHDKYIKEEEDYLKECISLLYSSNIADIDVFHTYYMTIYDEDVYKDARDEYFSSTITEALSSENSNPEDLRKLYTKSFGETYCVDSLQNIQISDKQRAYLTSLWQLSPLVNADIVDNADIKPKTFDDQSLSLLHQNIYRFKEVHLNYLESLAGDYWKMIIAMDLSKSERSSLFREFLICLSELGDQKKAEYLFFCYVDSLGKKQANEPIAAIRESASPLSHEQGSFLHLLISAYLSRSS